ncbi:MAG: helix-turn-helix domain-containing protein [Rhodopila sp.]
MANIDDAAFDGYGIRDKPLGFHWKADFQELTDVVPLPWARRVNDRQTIAAIFLDAMMEAQGLGRSISYSRRRQWWADARRYLGSTYGYSSVLGAVRALVEAEHLVDHWIAPAVPGGSGRQSTFRPAPSLAQVVLPTVSYSIGELMRLKDENGHLVNYRDTERTRRERRFLNEMNEAIGSLRIDLDAPHIVHEGTVIRCGDDHVLYPAMQALYRVFNGSSWKLGGRFYGGWWQQVRSADRKLLQIDGEPVVEHDYRQLHPRLIYARAEKQLDGDAYTVPGWDRNDAKPAFNILVNAPNYPSALGAITDRLDGDRHQAAMLINAIRDQHAAIAGYFHTGMGLKLQNTDAGMARSIMARLHRQGINTLPVHDSFIVKRRYEEALLEAMEAAEHEAGLVPICRVASISWTQSMPHMDSPIHMDSHIWTQGMPHMEGVVGVVAPVVGVVSLLPLFPDLPILARPAPPCSKRRALVPAGSRQPDLFGPPALHVADCAFADWCRLGGTLPRSMAAAVEAVRRERGHTLQAVASLIGLSRPQTANVVNGRFGTTPLHAARLAAYVRGDDLAA